MVSREAVIQQYFLKGYSYLEILQTLEAVHGITISLRQLNRILRSLHLYRRRDKSSLNDTLSAINNEIDGSAAMFGYRLMHQKLRSNGINADRETVRLGLKYLDPDGVESRTAHRFLRRRYVNKGPNYLWHIDGYDKLKPFGLAIHGAIDGYSRKMLWLIAAETNNNPKVVASFYMDAVNRLQRIPRCIRADRGSENAVLGGIQRYFRRNFSDSCSGSLSFIYGPSTRNQRIESWWSCFKKQRCGWWINFFKDLCDESSFDASIPYHVDCLRFCFLGIIQNDLDETRRLWNTHYIRKSKNSESPPGRPNVLYYTPQHSGGVEHSFSVNQGDLALANDEIRYPDLLACDEKVAEFISIVMREKNIRVPKNANEAKALLLTILEELEAI